MTGPPEAIANLGRYDEHVPAEDASDEALVARAQRDPDQFGALYGRYAGAIHAFVVHRTGDPDNADDITS